MARAAVARMGKRQSIGVKRVPREIDGHPLVADDVATFAHERMAMQTCLQSNLIALAGVQPYFEERGVTKRLERSVAADGFLAVGVAAMGPLLNEGLVVPHE